MSLFFNSSPFWDIFDSDIFDSPNSVRVSPKLIKGQSSGKDSKAVTTKDSDNDPRSLFKSLINDSVFDQGFDVVPPVDLVDKNDHYELHAAIPGVPEENINLDFDEDSNELTISGEIPEHHVEKKEGEQYYQELKTGSFQRKVRFGNDASLDSDKIKASYNNGILVVEVPKVAPKPKAAVKRIPVSKKN